MLKRQGKAIMSVPTVMHIRDYNFHIQFKII